MLLSCLDRLGGAFAFLIDGLCDEKRCRRTLAGLVCAYAAAWALYGVVAKSSQDINADMAELVLWGHHLALGYPKHPPLLAYIVDLWFAVFPQADWAFMVLAAVNVAAGIYLATELCARWLDGEKRAAAPFLLAAIPFYNFLGLKYDQNSALIPLWALAMLAFMRSLETRRPGWSLLAALAAAAAVLAKYWSGFLLAALALTLLFDRRRNEYLRSAAPWLAALVFVAIVVPHAIWLVREHFPPLIWIETRRMAQSVTDFCKALFEYSAGTLGYSAPALLLGAILFRPLPAAIGDWWFAADPARRPLTLLFWTPLILPIAVATAARIDLLSLWNAPGLNLLPAMMLASPLVRVSRLAVTRLATIVVIATLAAVAASPLVALVLLKYGRENNAAYARLAAAAVETQWRGMTGAPLRIVAGPYALVDSLAFYLKGAPTTYADFSSYLSPDVDDERIARDGVAIICPSDDKLCSDRAAKLVDGALDGETAEVTLTRHWLGFAGAPKRFVIVTLRPRGAMPQ